MSAELAEVRMLPAEKRRAARAAWRADPSLTGASLAKRFGEEPRWGRHQIAAARREADREAAAAADPPPITTPPVSRSPAGEAPLALPPATPAAREASPQVDAPTPEGADSSPPPMPPVPPHAAPREEPARPPEPPAAPAAPPAGEAPWSARAAAWARRHSLAAARLVVLAVAASLSYGHMVEVGLELNEPLWRARLWPLSVDGLALVALVTVREDPRRWGAWGALLLALGTSIAANVASAEPSVLGRLYAAWAPVALLVTEGLASRRHAKVTA